MFELSELQAWVSEHHVEQRVFQLFWLNFDNYKKEEPDEYEEYFADFDSEQLHLSIRSIAINYSNNYPDFDYNHVIVRLDIEYKMKDIGYYKLLLNFNGEVDDDFFVLY